MYRPSFDVSNIAAFDVNEIYYPAMLNVANIFIKLRANFVVSLTFYLICIRLLYKCVAEDGRKNSNTHTHAYAHTTHIQNDINSLSLYMNTMCQMAFFYTNANEINPHK